MFLDCFVLNTNGKPFKHQPHKMVKHTQTIRRQIPDKLFDHFVGLTLEELNTK